MAFSCANNIGDGRKERDDLGINKNYIRPMTTSCDNIGSTGDGMLPVSCQEQEASVSYPRAMGSLIQILKAN
jgi:hypothetical protein